LYVKAQSSRFEFTKISLTLQQQITGFNFYFDRNPHLEKLMAKSSDPVMTSMNATLHLTYQAQFFRPSKSAPQNRIAQGHVFFKLSTAKLQIL